MALRLAIAAGVLSTLSTAYLLWKRPPRRLVALDLAELGVEGPALVQFTTRYCAPCRAVRPELEAAADRAAIRYTQIDVGERPEVARRYGVRTVPTIVIAARSGRVMGKWTGLPGDGELSAAATRAARG
jgi:thioredoxin-like negative regulator of GroEL